MNLAYSTGNEIVDEVSEMNFTGNIVPMAWFKTMVGESGKPMLLAINLLADIVYWYRPKELRDEGTGELLGFKKRFKADFLQRSYRQIEIKFGVTKRQARYALDYLCNIGVVIKHLRDEITPEGIPLYNNMYLELVPEKLKELTYPQSDEGVPLEALPSVNKGDRVDTSKAEGGYKKCTTSTKTTTETKTIDYHNPINMDEDKMDVVNTYREIIKEKIEYDIIVHDDNGLNKEILDEILELITEIVAIERKTVYIGGEKYPYNLVKGKLLKLNSEHIRYVMNCMEKNTTKVRNIKNYLLTSLYNAPNTIGHYYQAEVNHDMYGDNGA